MSSPLLYGSYPKIWIELLESSVYRANQLFLKEENEKLSVLAQRVHVICSP